MKRIFFFTLLWLLLCKSLVAQVSDTAYELMLDKLLSHTVPEISVKEAASKSSNIIFLDAREKEEYEISHLKDAKYVGYKNFNTSLVNNIPKDQRIIVYCSVGYRSEKVAEQLAKAGYTHVTNLYGGIFEWVNEDHPVYDLSGRTTNKIHPYSSTWGVWLKKGEKVY